MAEIWEQQSLGFAGLVEGSALELLSGHRSLETASGRSRASLLVSAAPQS